MVQNGSKERLKTMLRDTITLLCKNGLEFSAGFSVEALIGITLDGQDVLLVNINEVIGDPPPTERTEPEPTKSEASASSASEDEGSPKRKRRKRKKNIEIQVKTEEAALDDDEDLVFVKQEVEDNVWNTESDCLATSNSDYLAPQPVHLFPSSSSSSWPAESTSSQDPSADQQYHLTDPQYDSNTAGGSQEYSQMSVGNQHYQKMRRWRCNICGIYCKTKDSLIRHNKRHLGKFKIVCSLCDRGFMSQYDLTQHMPVHTGAREHKCTVCSAEYRYKSDLKNHIKIKHPNQ